MKMTRTQIDISSYKGIRDTSKKVEVKDLETGEIKTYSSMYKCAKALKVYPGTVRFCNKR